MILRFFQELRDGLRLAGRLRVDKDLELGGVVVFGEVAELPYSPDLKPNSVAIYQEKIVRYTTEGDWVDAMGVKVDV